MKYLLESLLFTIGVLLMAVMSHSVLSTLIMQASPNTIVLGTDDTDAALTALVFCVGCFLAVYALFMGIGSDDN